MSSMINTADGTTGDVIVCGKSTGGVLETRKEYRGKKIKAIAAGYDLLLAIVDANELSWISKPDGLDIAKELGDVKLKQVSFGKQHAVGLSLDGHLYSWGEGSEGQLGVGTLIKKSLTPQRIHREDFVFSDVNCGANHTVALTDAGDCYAWGRGFEGQTGICDKNLSLEQNDLVHGYQPVPRHIAPLLGKRVIRVDCGENFTCVITGNGEIWSFGEAQSGQTGHGRLTRQLNPTLTIDKGVNGSPFVNVACGASHALALTLEGDLYAWGFNVYGQLGLGDTKTRFTPELVPDIKLQRIYAAGHYSCGITENGSVYTWGAGTHGQLGHGSTDHEPSPRLVKQTESIHVSALACGAADLMFFVPTWISNTHPVRGPISGHTTLTISGSGFWESDDITIRFVPTTDERLPRAALGDYDPETKQISCQTPKFALPGEVTLELAMNGKHFTGTGDVFDVFCPPEILACSPDEASSAGGSEITVIVQGFVKSDEAYMRFVNFDLPFQSSMVSCVLESLSVDSGEVLGPEAVNLPNEAVQTRIKGCTPDFQLDNLIRGSVELSFNAVDFMPVSILNEESNNRIPKQIIFHRAQIIRLKPNNIEIGKAFAFEIEGHDIFDLGQNELHVEFIDEKGDGSSVSAKALDMEVDEEKNLIRCKLPNLSQWEYSTPGESDEEEKIKTNPKWWKKYDYLRIQPKVSLNGGKSFLPTAPNAVLHYITSGTVDAIAPLYVPFSGGTELKLTGSTYPFDTPDAQLKFSFGANLVKLVPASYAQDGSCWTFTAPVFESKPPVVSEEDDAQEPSTTSQVSIFASLNGRTYFEAPIQLTYYVDPTVTSIEPSEGTVGTEVHLHGEQFIETNTIKIRLVSRETVQEVDAQLDGESIVFTIPELPSAESYQCHLALNGQQFVSSTCEFQFVAQEEA